jgi:hypothetical protein
MDYVVLFLLFMSAVARLKIVSNAIGRQRQQNYDVSAFCVNLVPNLGGLGDALLEPTMLRCGILRQRRSCDC